MAKPDLKTFRDRMDKSVAALKDDYAGLRTGRANAGLLEPVVVEAYGATSPLTAVAAISVPEPRMISVSVWDKGMVVSVEKAIRGMLPKNSLGRQQLTKLKVYAGAEHPHTAQQPTPYTITQVAQ